MDEAIILSLVIAIIISFFSSRKLRKKIEPITVLPIFAWLVFYGIPYCYHMICGLFLNHIELSQIFIKATIY